MVTTTEGSIANLTSMTINLTNRVSGKIDAIDARVDEAMAQVDQYILEQSPAIPQMNLAVNAGRFAVAGAPYSITTAPGFIEDPTFERVNGTTVTDAGKFIHDNTTHGGNDGVINQVVLDLLTAMGRTDQSRRFGVEFHIAEFTMGTGQNHVLAGTNKYLMLNNLFAFTGIDEWATSANWVRALGGDVAIRDVVRLNGLTPDNGTITLTPSDGWVHILRHHFKWQDGYTRPHLYPYAEAGTRLQVALPVVLPGRHLFPPHRAPIVSNTTYTP